MSIHKSSTVMAIIVLSLVSCKKETVDENIIPDNPLMSEFQTPFGVPAFDKIKDEHFGPAIREGIKQQQAEIDAIVNNKEAPTWDNTIFALDNSGQLLSRATNVFYNLNSAHTNDNLEQLAQELSPEISAHQDNIFLNPELFKRVSQVWEQQASLNLSPEQTKILDNTYKAFIRSGANLSSTDQEALRKINAELSLLSVKFGQNVLKDTNTFELHTENEADLAGLPEGIKEAAAETAKEKGKKGWVFTIQNASVMPFLQYSAVRPLREKMYKAYKNRGNNGGETDNNELVLRMTNLRLQKAKLLGFETYAHYALEETMAKTPERVSTFLADLWKPALSIAKDEIAEIQKMMRAEKINDAVQPWDYSYYSERIRKAKFDLDEQELTPYFSLEKVQDGIFMVTEKLWGLKYKQRTDIPVYHEDVTAWEVIEANGATVGLLYMDMHPRDSKRGGAWMTSYKEQKMEEGKRVPPVISIVCNFTKPTTTAPSLLTFDEVTTFFHEFGHALHGLLSNVTYESLAGTSVYRDFVELPSQVMENWAADPEVLKMYAIHYKTGEVIPDELITKLEKASKFGQGFATTEYLASAILDMEYHNRTTTIDGSAVSFEQDAMTRAGLPTAITPRHSSTHFGHIFAGGYSAGYYSYIWSGVLDTDAFDQFKKTGDLFNQDKALSFRQNILEKGGTEDPMELYKRFRGGEPSVEPLLRKRGLDRKK